MAKSKVINVESKGSWDGQYGTMYSFEYEFEDGTKGVANHQTNQPKHNKGDEVEYEISGQDKLMNNKIKFIQASSFNGYSKKQDKSNGSFALSYAKDLVIADKITIDQLVKTAIKFNNLLNKMEKENK